LLGKRLTLANKRDQADVDTQPSANPFQIPRQTPRDLSQLRVLTSDTFFDDPDRLLVFILTQLDRPPE
jgi:hypothetical protein